MKLFSRSILTVAFATAMAWSASAEHYQCQNIGGCSATITTGGKTRTVLFRKGDLIDTDAGWLPSPKGGWSKVVWDR